MSQVNETSTSTPTWREKLAEWLRHNSLTIPEDLRRLREEFVHRFPKENLSEMELEDYALGLEPKDGFCYWLEQKLSDLGGIGGGSSEKFGVWWSKKDNRWRWIERYASQQEAMASIREGLSAMVEAVEQERFEVLERIDAKYFGPSLHALRCKPLSLYFPEEFLPVAHPKHLANFLEIFDSEPRGELHSRNRQLLQLLRSHPEFEGFDTLCLMRFLYDSYPQKKVKGEGGPPEPEPEPEIGTQHADIPRELKELLDITERPRTGNVLLYGPPGVGKTWLVGRFAKYFLRPQLSASADTKQHRFAVLQRLKWYEVIALAIALAGGRKKFEVPELAADDLIRDYHSLYQVANLKPALWGHLQDHTAPDSANVNTQTSRRREPFLFQKDEKSAWSLTDAGRQYVEANLAEELAQMRVPVASSLEDFYEFVTFHQSFAYEEFVEGLKPVTDEAGGVSYEVVPGVFRRICARAEAAWRTHGEDAPKYLLVVDEINRANIAKVLGELITLIEDDKRLGRENQLTATLPYSGERFGVPPNLYILGTMNTADRSIALLDLALRRRFTFVEMEPEPSAIEPASVAGVDLRALLAGLNERVAALLDRDHRIGHSYLMNLTNEPSLRFAWYARVVPLLQEYFYNDGERLLAVLGPRFVRRTRVSRATAAALGELYDSEQPPHEVARLEGADFLEALRELAGGRAAGAEAEENQMPEEAGTED
jgi:5-methylcytosine-specific restriction protein B